MYEYRYTYRFCVDAQCFSQLSRFSNLKREQPQQHLTEDERLRSKTLKEQSLWGAQLSERKLVLNSVRVTEQFIK